MAEMWEDAARNVIALVNKFVETWPRGDVAIFPGQDGPEVWIDRLTYAEARDEALAALFAWIDLTLNNPDRDRTQVLEGFLAATEEARSRADELIMKSQRTPPAPPPLEQMEGDGD